MSRFSSSIAALLVALLVAWQLHFRQYLAAIGVGRSVESIGNTNCKTVPELQACEKIVLHQPTGTIYLACSTLRDRVQWMPAVNKLNASGTSGNDHIATYDPQTNAVRHLSLSGFSSPGGLFVHGMDVVASIHDPSILYVYVVNHRKPISGDPRKIGADSVIEVFQTQTGGSELKYIRTFEDPAVVITPNDVVGSPDGQSVYFTNDNSQKLGLKRHLNLFIQPSDTSVGFCHVDHGCKFAFRGLHASNGIVKGFNQNNDTFYVADYMLGEITVLEKRPDNTLAFIEVIKTGYAADNLAVDSNGALWVAVLSDLLGLIYRKFDDPSQLVASAALRVTVNNGPSSFYGEKYNVDKVFEDPGNLASGITSAVYDSERGQLFLHGVISTHLTVCRL
ncbi:hypothetical protein V8B97DRAFT_1932047 [Scleroderma yunnanense]